MLGARVGEELFQMMERSMPLPVRNDTCVHNRALYPAPEGEMSFDALMDWYAAALLGQVPCMRMTDTAGRKQFVNDPHLKAVIYHTVKFCDYYGFEYSALRRELSVPMLKLESDYTVQSSGQLLTRLEAFAESMTPADTVAQERKKAMNGKRLVCRHSTAAAPAPMW